jgi:hypothetical protein
VIIDVHNPGTPHQTIAFTQVLVPDPTNPGTFMNAPDVDDVIKPNATAGTFYLSDTGNNQVLAVHATGLNVNDYYASVGNAFGQVDPTTGDFTPLVTGSNFQGAEFVADANPQTAVSANEQTNTFTFGPALGNTTMNATMNPPEDAAQIQGTLHPEHDLAATLAQLLAEAPHPDTVGMNGTDAFHQMPLASGHHDFHVG